MKKYSSLLPFLAIVFAISAIGSYYTMPEIPTWYASLQKPSFSPPNWVFGPVWTTLYIMIAIAGWRVWQRLPQANKLNHPAMRAYALQLALNCSWSIVFFGYHQIGFAVANIALLWLSIIATIILFRTYDKAAAWLLAPYLAWVSFASALNFAIWQMN